MTTYHAELFSILENSRLL